MPLVNAALQCGTQAIVTFGGARSNHLLAMSYVSKLFGVPTIGVVRGEEVADDHPVIDACIANGMKIIGVPRDDYVPLQHDKERIVTLTGLDDVAIILEGGTAPAALLGVATLVREIPDIASYDVIACAVGTGGTALGIALGLELLASKAPTRVLALSALKGYEMLPEQGEKALDALVDAGFAARVRQRIDFVSESSGRGYAKTTPELMAFIRDWQQQTNIPLDYVYTGKALHWLMENDMCRKRVLFIHTGGYATAPVASE